MGPMKAEYAQNSRVTCKVISPTTKASNFNISFIPRPYGGNAVCYCTHTQPNPAQAILIKRQICLNGIVPSSTFPNLRCSICLREGRSWQSLGRCIHHSTMKYLTFLLSMASNSAFTTKTRTTAAWTSMIPISWADLSVAINVVQSQAGRARKLPLLYEDIRTINTMQGYIINLARTVEE